MRPDLSLGNSQAQSGRGWVWSPPEFYVTGWKALTDLSRDLRKQSTWEHGDPPPRTPARRPQVLRCRPSHYTAATRMTCSLNTTVPLLPTSDQQGHHHGEAKAFDKGSRRLWALHTPTSSLVWKPSSSPLETDGALLSVPSLSTSAPSSLFLFGLPQPLPYAALLLPSCPSPRLWPGSGVPRALPSRIKLIGKKQAHPSSLLL